MRIPLDYYQILGVPEGSLLELEQACQDRLAQLPRQEYSDAAIESRKQLISLAYQVLSDPQQRQQYQAVQLSIATNAPDGTSTVGSAVAASFEQRASLEISPEHFLGGLLILFERGEYEEINSICMPYIGNGGRSSNSGNLHLRPALTTSGNLQPLPNSQIDPAIFAKIDRTPAGSRVIPLLPDIVLTMTFSLLELGDREWRDRAYEAAVSHFETARKILVQEDLFPQIQGQIERRLDRLRPYRISYLVALPLDRHEQRTRGIQFLEELLQSACTNEVECKSRFGLNSERTIQFIHETLPNLTAGEQSHLFSQLARESHQLGADSLTQMQLACTYLHVHALIAQGFAYHNPQLIYRAQQILLYRLRHRLDVGVEQAICALLMGQTEEAESIVKTAPESAALVVIRQQSQGMPNLLRGLCWYIESWLKDEAFPCFRDLINSDPSIHHYFSDVDVQDFADRATVALCEQTDLDRHVSGWATSTPQLIPVQPSGDLSTSGNLPSTGSNSSLSGSPAMGEPTMPQTGTRPSDPGISWQSALDRLGSGVVLPAERVGQTPQLPSLPTLAERSLESLPAGTNVIQLESERMRRRPSAPTARTLDGQVAEYGESTPIAPAINSSQLLPSLKSGQLVRTDGRNTGTITRRRLQRKPHLPRIAAVGMIGVSCLYGGFWLVNAAWDQLRGNSAPAPIAVDTPIPSPPAITAPKTPPSTAKPIEAGVLTKDAAQQLIETWLSAKAKSLGPEYQTAQLKDILAEPALSVALSRAKSVKADGGYIKYKHNLTIASITQANPLANTATIQAQVKEDAQYYEKNQTEPVKSTSNQYLVKYDLIRQDLASEKSATPDIRWYVKQIDVIN